MGRTLGAYVVILDEDAGSRVLDNGLPVSVQHNKNGILGENANPSVWALT